MIKDRIGAALAALLTLLLAACQSGPSPADVAADRARWTAIRDKSVADQARLEHIRTAVADGVLTEQEQVLVADALRTYDLEAPVFAMFLLVWDSKLQADEAAAKVPQDPKGVLLELIRVYGFATVQVVLAPVLQEKAPAVFRLLDKNGNGVLEEPELAAIDPTDPVFAFVVITTVRELLQRHR